MNQNGLKPKALWRLVSLFAGHWQAVVTGTFLLLLTTGLTLLPPWLVRCSLDAVRVGEGSQIFGLVFLAIVGAALLKGVLYYWQRMLMERTGQEIVHRLRSDAMLMLNRRSFAFFDSAEIGDLVSRVTSDTDMLTSFYGMGLVNIFNNILTICGILAVLFLWNPSLCLAFVVLLPFMLHAMLTYARHVRPAMAQVRKEFGGLTAMVQQRVTGIEVVKLLGTERIEKEGFVRRAEGVLSKNLAASRIQAFWLPYVFFLLGLGTALTVIWGGRLIITGHVTQGMLLGFLSYIALLLRPIRQTGMLLGMVMTSTVAAERLFEVMDGKLENLETGKWPGSLQGEIEFRSVNFAYDGAKEVLQGVSLTLPAKKTVALVGPSGSGKSTLVSLVPGFYKPQSGDVLVDGISTSEIHLGKLRQNIGFLHQSPFLFDGTVLDNLTFARPDADSAEIEVALQRTALADFIFSLPEGLQTKIGEKGVKLSGGQKQRLAMARVLITDPRILILDEPTSSLDRETEKEINASITEAFLGRTVVVIAHRLWTITRADIVVFLREGQVQGVGSHQELLQQCPDYSHFVSSQLSGQEGVAI